MRKRFFKFLFFEQTLVKSENQPRNRSVAKGQKEKEQKKKEENERKGGEGEKRKKKRGGGWV